MSPDGSTVPIVTDAQRTMLEQYTPQRALLRGFAQYRISIYNDMRRKDPTLPTTQDEIRAYRLIERQDAFLDTIPTGTLEGEFVVRWLEAAFSYQQGLASAGRHLKARTEKAEKRRAMDLDRSLITTSSTGLFKGGVWLASIGACGAFAALMFYSVFGRGSDLNQWWLALTTGTAMLVVAIGWLMNRAGRSLTDIDGEWYRTTGTAEINQALAHRQHQKIALAMGRAAWRVLFEHEPNDDDIEIAVVGLVELNIETNKPAATPSLSAVDVILRIRAIAAAVFRGIRKSPPPAGPPVLESAAGAATRDGSAVLAEVSSRREEVTAGAP